MPPATAPLSAHPSPWRAAAWLALVLGALAFLLIVDRQRIRRIKYVSNSPYWSVEAPVEDATSPTGYAGQRRQLVVPGHHTPGYFWIMRTQQVFAGHFTSHHVDYDNFPAGRASRDTSPYRWWLTAVARLDHLLSSRPLPLAAEHAALYADPLLHVLLVAGVAVLAWGCFGGVASAAAAIALATLFPLAGGFQPGAPDHHALAWVLIVAGVLPLLAGLAGARATLWFGLAGVAGGLGLWNDHLVGEPVLAGLALGGAFAAWLLRRDSRGTPPWRIWGFAGAATSLVAWAIEYFPANPGLSVDSIHPLHALLCLGLGELLHRLSPPTSPEAKARDWRDWCALGLAAVAIAALPVARLFAKDGHFLADDSLASELVNLPNGVRAAGTGAWLRRDGLTAVFNATFLPLLLVAVALFLTFSAQTAAAFRRALAVALGPVLVALVLAWIQPRWWNGCDAALAALLVVVIAATESATAAGRRWLGRSGAVLVALPGFFLLPPPAGARGEDPLDENDVTALVERDLAHWLAQQHGKDPTVVFTTPGLSEALAYYGNIKGVVSFDPDNEAGLSAATRIASSATSAESTALLENRQVTHVIIPSWDPTLRRFAQLGRQVAPGAPVPADTLVARLESWSIPAWLRLMSYHTPTDLGAGTYSAQVLAVQAEPEAVLSACRLADYFVEMGMADRAAAFRDELRLYPRSLPALAALAQIDQAIGDRAGYEATMQTLLPYVSRRGARTLTIDRRISLSALLIQAKQPDLTREQMQQCLAALNAENLRELTTGEIVRLVAITDLLKLPFPDPELRRQALSLVPPTLRARLEKSAAR